MNILCLGIGLVLLVAGLLKVIRYPTLLREFRHHNLPDWSLVTIGIVEITAAVLLLLPGTSSLGAVVAILVLNGATVINWVKGTFLKSLIPLGFLVLTLIYLWQVDPEGMPLTVMLGLSVFLLAIGLHLWGYPRTKPNEDGDQERLPGGAQVTHHFREALGVKYHFVTAGDPSRHPLLIIPGAPESWYCMHHQINSLSTEYYVIGLDLKPYGQTDKDLDGDHSFEHIAAEIADLLNGMGIRQFHLASHDRGTVAADNLLGQPGFAGRVTAYIRMQQSFDQPHGDPVPPHKLMGSFVGTLAFGLRWGMWFIYRKSFYVKHPIDRMTVRRITKEWRMTDMAQAVPQSFKTTSFAKELADRQDRFFALMTMPILLLQGSQDPGQHPEEYENSHLIGPDIQVQFIDAGHFFHLEAPKPTNAAFRSFLAKHTPISTTISNPTTV